MTRAWQSRRRGGDRAGAQGCGLAALTWPQEHAAELGADASRTYLCSASAGGHLAALAALTAPAGAVQGVVCWYPITDLLALDLTSTDSLEAMLLGGPIGEHLDLARAASPAAHAHPGAPPFLLQHGEADTWVPVGQSIRLAERLRTVGGRVTLDIIPGADHFFGGASDVEAIFERAVDFLLTLDRVREPGQSPIVNWSRSTPQTS